MKKVFFTAIAMIAFTSVSMANTIADEKVVTEEKKEAAVKKTLCQIIAEFRAQDTYNQTGSQSAANTSYQLALTACILGL
jgi:hypothetical protein